MEQKDKMMSEGQMDGMYRAGVKDLASAYVLCLHLSEHVCVFLFAEGRNHGKGLRLGFEDMDRSDRRSAERQNKIGLIYKLKLHYYSLLGFIRNRTISTD